MIKCAWCNGDQLCTEKEQPPAWTYRKCPECLKMNKFRPIDKWEGDLKTTEIVSEMLSESVPHNATEMPRSWTETPWASRASDSDLGRAIQNIINRSKKP